MRLTQASSQVQKQIFNRSKKRMQKSWAAKRPDREGMFVKLLLTEYSSLISIDILYNNNFGNI